MKIVIEIPVQIDDPLTASERRKLKEHIGQSLETLLTRLFAPSPTFNSDPRMLGTICRFRFMAPKARVE